MDRKKLEHWIRRQVYDDTDRPEGRCFRLVLKHLGASRREGQEISGYRVPPAKKCDENWILETVNRLEADSMADAGGIGGVQSYVVLSLFEKSGERPLARFTFREAGHDEVFDDDESEPATKTGHVAQMMRHNEAIMRIATVASGQALSYLQRVNASQGETIEKLIAERMANFEVVETLKSQHFERALILEKERNQDKRTQDAFEKLMALAPVVVNKIAGKRLLPEHTTPEKEMLKSLLESLTPAQFESLQTILKPEQAVLIASMMEQFSREEPPSQSGNGSANSSGGK